MARTVRHAVKIISKKLHHDTGSESSSGSDDGELSVEISKKLDDELICFLAICLENQSVMLLLYDKVFGQTTPLEQISAALPKISSSPHPSLLDQLTRALHHPQKYQRLTQLVQAEEKGWKKMENGDLILATDEWGHVQMLANVLAQQYDEPLLHVLLVKCILHRKAGKVLEAIDWARRGLSKCDEETPEMVQDLLKKALAIALSTAAARCVISQHERGEYRTEAIELLRELSERHPDDAIILYNYAVLLAEKARFAAATRAVKRAMGSSNGSFDPAWALYALILSANREYEAALNAIDGGVTECGKLHKPLLLIVKARLLMAYGSPSEGINLIATACGNFKRAQPSEDDNPNWVEINKEQQAILWKELTELYLRQERFKDAEYSFGEMEQLIPSTPESLSVKGDINQSQRRARQACQLYEMALAIDPNQEAATLSLGRLYRIRGEWAIERKLDGTSDLILGQSLLSSYIQVLDPNSYEGWYNLGLVCKAQGRLDEAKKHLQYAVSLAAISPVMGFKYLPRVF